MHEILFALIGIFLCYLCIAWMSHFEGMAIASLIPPWLCLYCLADWLFGSMKKLKKKGMIKDDDTRLFLGVMIFTVIYYTLLIIFKLWQP